MRELGSSRTRAYPLDEHDRARAAAGDALALGALGEPVEQDAHEDAADRCAQPGVVAEQEAHAVGEGEHPLADGDVGQHVVDEVSGEVGHAAGPAGGAEASAFASEGDQVVVAAARAVHAREAEGQQAAFEVARELAAHEAGQARTLLLLGARQEGGQVFSQDAVQEAAFGLASFPASPGRTSRRSHSRGTAPASGRWRALKTIGAPARGCGPGIQKNTLQPDAGLGVVRSWWSHETGRLRCPTRSSEWRRLRRSG